jgi:hypothetical protein
MVAVADLVWMLTERFDYCLHVPDPQYTLPVPKPREVAEQD